VVVVIVVAIVIFLPAVAGSPEMETFNRELSTRGQAILAAPAEERLGQLIDLLNYMRDPTGQL